MRRRVWLALSAAAFLIYNVHHWWRAPGDDWSSIWVAASMVRHGRADLLYTVDPNRFTDLGDPATWMQFATDTGRTTLGHPYVHEPLLAYALSFLAGDGSWGESLHVLLVLDVLAMVGIVWLVGRLWAPSFLQPVPFAIVLLGLSVSEPLRYGLWLGQTTPVILFLTVAGVALARRHPLLAGVILALPVSIKITPVLVALWWLIDRRRRKALLGLVGGLLVLACVQLVFVSPAVLHAYVDALRHVQRITTTGYSNQSLAGWLVDFTVHQPAATYPTRTVPGWMSALSSAALVLTAGGAAARALWVRRSGGDAEGMATAALLLAALPFTPLSWTHYYLILVVPIGVLVTAARRCDIWWPYLAVAVCVALSMQPLAVNGPANFASPDSIVRSHLLTGVIALAALLALPLSAWQRGVAEQSPESPESPESPGSWRSGGVDAPGTGSGGHLVGPRPVTSAASGLPQDRW